MMAKSREKARSASVRGDAGWARGRRRALGGRGEMQPCSSSQCGACGEGGRQLLRTLKRLSFGLLVILEHSDV